VVLGYGCPLCRNVVGHGWCVRISVVGHGWCVGPTVVVSFLQWLGLPLSFHSCNSRAHHYCFTLTTVGHAIIDVA
jgi:hypothetical protein